MSLCFWNHFCSLGLIAIFINLLKVTYLCKCFKSSVGTVSLPLSICIQKLWSACNKAALHRQRCLGVDSRQDFVLSCIQQWLLCCWLLNRLWTACRSTSWGCRGCRAGVHPGQPYSMVCKRGQSSSGAGREPGCMASLLEWALKDFAAVAQIRTDVLLLQFVLAGIMAVASTQVPTAFSFRELRNHHPVQSV